MGTAMPLLTIAELTEGRFPLKDGHEFLQSLPALVSDSKRASEADPQDPKSDYYGLKSFDPNGYAKNRELAQDICAAFEKHKKRDEHGSHFILAWRLYPNKDHPRWQGEEHVCGCGDGGYCPPENEPR